jgi:hypothetical protein
MARFILAALLINLCACSGMQTVSVSELREGEAPAEIRPGDRVEVITRDNEKMEFSVTEINDLGVGGKFGFIPYDHMRRLQVRRPGSGGGQNTGWLWGAIGVAALIALIASADSVAVCSPGPCPIPAQP